MKDNIFSENFEYKMLNQVQVWELQGLLDSNSDDYNSKIQNLQVDLEVGIVMEP